MVTGAHRAILCRELVELLTDYLEGVLPPEEVAAVEAHLAVCPGCVSYLDQMRTTIKALGRLPVESVPEDALDELLGAFRHEHGSAS
jgi:anti-sigma factor RsiW